MNDHNHKSTGKGFRQRDNSPTVKTSFAGNAGWLYYKEYYRKLACLVSCKEKEQKSAMETVNRKLYNMVLPVGDMCPSLQIPYPQIFTLSTTHPGLLTGSGISHAAGIEGEFKLGFNFDHTTGLPVIYGSTIKGMLRSAFPQIDPKKQANEDSDVEQSKCDYIYACLNACLKKCSMPLADVEKEGKREFVNALCQRIFNGVDDQTGKPVPPYERDLFFDAYPKVSLSANAKLFDFDYITPHPDALKEPKPVLFMKLRSGIAFEFCFSLKEIEVKGTKITSKVRSELFKQIILDFGLGAKTNVGYGQFEETKQVDKP